MVIAYAATGMRYYLSRVAVADSSRYVYVTAESNSTLLKKYLKRARAAAHDVRACVRMEAPTIDRDLLSAWKPDTTFRLRSVMQK